MKKVKRITDKMRLDWLIKNPRFILKSELPLMQFVILKSDKKRQARQAIDAAINRSPDGRSGV